MQLLPYMTDVIFLGSLARETIINKKGEVFLDKPGGNLLYSSYACKLWGKNPALLSKVGISFSEDWIDKISHRGVNTAGIKRLPQDLEHRKFYFIDPSGQVITEYPQKYFAEMGHPFPKILLGYANQEKKLDSKHKCSKLTVKPDDIPIEYFDCRNLALCPLDFISHNLITTEFRSKNNARIFMHAGCGYMHYSFFNEVPALVSGAELLFTSQRYAKDFFRGKIDDVWEMLEFFSSFNIEIVIIQDDQKGTYLFLSSNKKKVFLPHYPVEIVDPVGFADAYFGGFVACYLKHFDPLIAAAGGAATASIKREGSKADFLLDALPELANARLEKLLSEIQFC